MQVPPRHCLSFSQHGSRIPPAWETQETKAKAAMPFVTQAWKSYSVTYTVLCWSQRPALSQCGRREHTSMSPRRQGSSASHQRPATIMHLTKAQQVMIDALLLLYTTTQVQISITVLQLFHNCLSFLLHSASLFQRSFTNFLLAKKELSSTIGHISQMFICAAKSKHNFVEFGGLKFASLLSNEVKTNH